MRLIDEIMKTHAPDEGALNIDPIRLFVEDIFKRAIPSAEYEEAIATARKLTKMNFVRQMQATTEDNLDDKKEFDKFSIIPTLKSLRDLIDGISYEITCSCSAGGDSHTLAITILTMLSSYSWLDKLMIALLTFAVTYGEFWLVSKSYTSNQAAKTAAILKQLPDILQTYGMLEPQYDSIKTHIRQMIDINKFVFEFIQIPSRYDIQEAFAALSQAQANVPVAVYWTIRSISACASQLIRICSLVWDSCEHIIPQSELDLSGLDQEFSGVHSNLKTQLYNCYKYIHEKKYLEVYQNLLVLLEMKHDDNARILKALIYQKDDIQPLLNGMTKRRANLDVLRQKHVLLFISDLDVGYEERCILELIYSETRGLPARHDSQYEVVWLPILDPTVTWTEAKQKRFEDLQLAMPWYTVYHPSLINLAVVNFVKEHWNFGGRPILVVLDPQGQVVCMNAFPLMWVWGPLAFPFTTSREEALWKEESWRLELVVNGIDPMILHWMAQRKYICLYGGEDIEWIRNFTTTAAAVARDAGIDLEMVYVGKSYQKDRVRRNMVTILVERLGHCWSDPTLLWFFWVRLESMWYSKNQLGRNVENDTIMREIMALLMYDGGEGGWVVFARGSAELIRAKGDTSLICLQNYNGWMTRSKEIGFFPALQEQLKQLPTPRHCNQLMLPTTNGRMVSDSDKMVCPDCGRAMDLYITFQCGDDDKHQKPHYR